MSAQGRNTEWDNRDWQIFRDAHGTPRWWQGLYEALLIVTRRHSLHRAWQRGLEMGSKMEYRRLITNKAYLAEIAAIEKQLNPTTLTAKTPEKASA